MVAGFAAHAFKEIDTCVYGIAQILECFDLFAADSFQSCDVFRIIRFFDIVGLIRSETRNDDRFKSLVFPDQLMIVQIITRIIRRADDIHF